MPIKFPVAPGTVLLCDYSTGFLPPEMVKLKPAIVVSPVFLIVIGFALSCH